MRIRNRHGTKLTKHTIFKVLGGGILTAFIATVAVGAGALTQGFLATVPVATGSTVSLTKGTSNTVEKTTLENESTLVGVASNSSDSLIGLQSAGSQILVTVSGDANLLVTDLNGEIKPGDKLTVSALSGVAMLFTTDVVSKKIVATAGKAFTSKNADVVKIDIKDANGAKKTVSVGIIPVKLILNDRTSADNKQSQNVFASFSEKLTGKPTNSLKVVASMVVALGTFVLAGLILNGSVKGSFISLGRNPLSRDSIVNGMLRASILAIVIIAMGLSAAYLILLV